MIVDTEYLPGQTVYTSSHSAHLSIKHIRAQTESLTAEWANICVNFHSRMWITN